jgi:hypothetical protein
MLLCPADLVKGGDEAGLALLDNKPRNAYCRWPFCP